MCAEPQDVVSIIVGASIARSEQESCNEEGVELLDLSRKIQEMSLEEITSLQKRLNAEAASLQSLSLTLSLTLTLFAGGQFAESGHGSLGA